MGYKTYAHEDHYKWVESVTKKPMSDLGKTVANILGFVGGGIYNAPIKATNIDWADDHCIAVTWSRDLGNYDFCGLSMLWVLCHRKMIRVTIHGIAPRRMQLMFWQRQSRDGGIGERMPDCEDMIKMIDDAFVKIDDPDAE